MGIRTNVECQKVITLLRDSISIDLTQIVAERYE